MKLEFLASGSPDCPLIRLYDFDVPSATRLRELFQGLSMASLRTVALDTELGVEAIGGCHLRMLLGNRDTGVNQTAPLNFDFVLTSEGWAEVADLTEPFVERRISMSTINGSTKTGKFLFCSRQLAVGEVGRPKRWRLVMSAIGMLCQSTPSLTSILTVSSLGRRMVMTLKNSLIAVIFALTQVMWAQSAPGKAPASGPGRAQPRAEHHQDMMEMHKQEMEAMKADVEKIKASLAQMKANLLTIRERNELDRWRNNLDMWEVMVGHMDRMLKHMESVSPGSPSPTAPTENKPD
jgi:hypothetical protein